MGKSGGARGRWCMYWRLSIQEWMEGEGNKAAMHELAARTAALASWPTSMMSRSPGADSGPLGPFHACTLLTAATRRRGAVISLTCLLIKKDHRGQGLASALITAVCNYLADAGETRVMEAYPIEPPQGRKAGRTTP